MKRRNILIMVILTIVTLGFYQIFWTFLTKQELNRSGAKVPRFIWLVAPLFLLVFIALLQFFANFVMSDVGGTSAVTNILSIVLGIVALLSVFPIYLIWFYKYCEGVAKVTNNDLPTGLNYVLLLALTLLGFGFVWSYIVQNSYNKLITAN